MFPNLHLKARNCMHGAPQAGHCLPGGMVYLVQPKIGHMWFDHPPGISECASECLDQLDLQKEILLVSILEIPRGDIGTPIRQLSCSYMSGVTIYDLYPLHLCVSASNTSTSQVISTTAFPNYLSYHMHYPLKV